MNDETLKQDLIKTGGYAYPHFPHTIDGNPQINGMTLRDYFAAKVLSNSGCIDSFNGLARFAYAVADAMIAERVK